ncbi:hypothetical protein GOB50_32875, partial [Sinorhizobium meliloti]|nr:hypothetical protein [Sinorhizobium meliloti]
MQEQRTGSRRDCIAPSTVKIRTGAGPSIHRPKESAMDDLKYGTRNKRGDWAPNQPVET